MEADICCMNSSRLRVRCVLADREHYTLQAAYLSVLIDQSERRIYSLRLGSRWCYASWQKIQGIFYAMGCMFTIDPSGLMKYRHITVVLLFVCRHVDGNASRVRLQSGDPCVRGGEKDESS